MILAFAITLSIIAPFFETPSLKKKVECEFITRICLLMKIPKMV